MFILNLINVTRFNLIRFSMFLELNFLSCHVSPIFGENEKENDFIDISSAYLYFLKIYSPEFNHRVR